VVATGNADFGNRNLAVTLGGSPAGSTFELVRYGGTLGQAPVVVLSTDAGRLIPEVNNGTGINDAITLSFTGAVADLVWTGSFSNVWDDNLTPNFLNGAAEDNFRAFDNVRFDDSSAQNAVSLSGNLRAGTVTFDHDTAAYTLDGAGAIAGPAALVKSGSGTLTLNTTNTYSGPTSVTGGTLALNGNHAGATGAITVGGAGSVLTGSGTAGGGITVADGATFAPGGPATGTFTTGSGAPVHLQTGATFRAHIDSSGPPAASRLVLNGDLTLASGVALEVIDLAAAQAALPVDTKLVLIDCGANLLEGTFEGLPEGAPLTIGSTNSPSVTRMPAA
jgi:autotransporter-associated beta strand protein